MKSLKITEDDGSFIEISSDLISDGGNDVPAVLISCKWDDAETFINISNVDEITELIRWLSQIRNEIINFNKTTK